MIVLRTLTDSQKEAAGSMGVRGLVQYVLNYRDLHVYLAENGSDDNSGGNTEHVFGGCERGPLTGDVAVNLNSGTITRRVYGGCYNECGFSFETAYYITGNVTLTISGSTNITLSLSNDRSIYARSRQNKASATEVSTLIFADQAAYTAYSSKLGANDTTMKLIMGSISAADSIITP